MLKILLFLLIGINIQAQTLEHKNRIAKAIFQQESGSGRDTINELDRNSKGYFQIRTQLVDDVNRILGVKRFDYSDVFDYKESVKMFFYYTNYYVPNWDYEQVAKNWGCGPRAKQRGKCEKYWTKTKQILNQ